MYARNTFEHRRCCPDPFLNRNYAAPESLFLDATVPRKSPPFGLLYFHALTHSSRFHTTPNAPTFLALSTLQQKTGGRGARSLERLRPNLSTFNFELSTSLRINPIIPALTSPIAITPIVPALMQNRGWGGEITVKLPISETMGSPLVTRNSPLPLPTLPQ